MDKSSEQTIQRPANISRRQLVQGGLALALTGLLSDKAFACEGKAATFRSAADLRRAIQTAPEEKPGKPGLYFVNLSDCPDYPVIGIRRTMATTSELHKSFTDVWYVIEGAATLVTGGSIVEGVESLPGEIRGRSIKGGNERRIQSGDFAIIPAGVAHWISKVEGKEFLYLVAKVPTKS